MIYYVNTNVNIKLFRCLSIWKAIYMKVYIGKQSYMHIIAFFNHTKVNKEWINEHQYIYTGCP